MNDILKRMDDYMSEKCSGEDKHLTKKQREKLPEKLKKKIIAKKKNEEEILDEATLTKKHFQIFTDKIKTINDMKIRKYVADFTADIFIDLNPLFDRERYLKACGV